MDDGSADHAMQGHSSHGGIMGDQAPGTVDAASVPSVSPLQLSVNGTLHWGGMGGVLTLENTSGDDLNGWEVSFLTQQSNLRFWSANATEVDQGNGTVLVTLEPAAWNASIPAGGSINLAFNADSVGLPDSGTLTNSLFFVADGDVVTTAEAEPAQEPAPEPEPAPPLEPSAVQVEATVTDQWSGTFAGTLSVTNAGPQALEAGWSVNFLSDHALKQVSNFSLSQEQQRDGRYRVTLAAPSWSEAQPFAAGATLTSYYQGSGELGGSSVLTFSGTDSSTAASAPAASTGPAQPVESQEPVDSFPPDPPQATKAAVEPGAATDDVTPPFTSETSASGDGMRVVGYFEEWGIYGRDFRVADVDASKLTHLNYSFFGVDDSGDLFIHDPWAATDKRFEVNQQVSRTFSSDEWFSLDAADRDGLVNGGDFSVTTEADGSVTLTGIPIGWDDPDAEAGNLRQLDLLKQLNPQLNIGLALGGWTLSGDFSLLASA